MFVCECVLHRIHNLSSRNRILVVESIITNRWHFLIVFVFSWIATITIIAFPAVAMLHLATRKYCGCINYVLEDGTARGFHGCIRNGARDLAACGSCVIVTYACRLDASHFLSIRINRKL